MKDILIPAATLFNELTDEFIYTKPQVIRIEHSLISISKWEAKWKQPFFSTKSRTREQFIDYVQCMTLTPNVDPYVYRCLTEQNVSDIMEYINDPMTATTFSNRRPQTGKSKKRIITSEQVYYRMIQLGIPLECEKWHLNRLLTLIKIATINSDKHSKNNKMSDREIHAMNHEINEERKRALNSNG